MMKKYSKYYSKQNKQIENTALLRLIKIVNTIPFANKATFAINNQ